MNNRFSRIVCGFLSVVMCIFSTVNVANVRAEETVYKDVLDIISSSATINNQPITSDTVVRDGDAIKFNLVWELNDGGYKPPATFEVDLNLSHVNLQDMTIGGTPSVSYEIKDSKLYITLKEGELGRDGSCSFEGTLNIKNKNDLSADNRVTITYLDKTFTPKTNQFATGLWLNKSAGTFRYDDVSGKYYQGYRVEVHNYTANPVTNATLVDTFKYDETGIFANEDLKDFRLDGVTIGASSGDSITIATIPANGSVVAEYEVEVSADKALSGKDRSNTAVVNYNNGNEPASVTGTAWANPNVPSVSKSGNYDATDKQIDWVITIYPNMLSNGDVTFSVKDTPGSNLTAADIATATGGTNNGDGTVTIPSSKFVYDSATKTYTYSYSTGIPDNGDDTIFGTNVGNNVSVTFDVEDKEYTYNAGSSVTIPGISGDFIDKTGSDMDANGVIPWTITLTIPNDPTITGLTLWDKPYDNPSYNPNNYGNHTIDVSSIKLTSDGADVAIVPKNNGDGTINIDFGSANNDGNNPVAPLLGKTVLITYNTQADVNAQGYRDLPYYNETQIWIKSSMGEIFQNASAIVSPDITASKGGTHNGDGIIKWEIKAKNLAGKTYTEGDIITVTDALPEGHSFYPNNGYGVWLNENITLNAPEIDGQNVTFTINFSANAAQAFTSGAELSLYFHSKMNNDAYSELLMNNANGSKVNVDNTAVISTDPGSTEDDVAVSGSAEITVNNANLLTKSASNEVKNNDNTFTATYTIEVNKGAIDLNPDGDTLTLTDTLGAWMEYDGGLSIYPSDGVIHSINGKTISAVLKDNTYYVIKYNIKGEQVPDGQQASPEMLNKMFSNTVTLTGAGSESISSSASISSNTYQSDFAYNFDIKLTGQKTWNDTLYTAARPKSITILINYVKTNPLGEEIESGQLQTSTVVTPDSSNDNIWSYTISNLVSMDEKCNRYTYTIEEVAVDGYTVEIGETNEVSTGININMKNTFTAHTVEVGALKVTKDWDHGSNANPPAESVTVTLYEVVGNTETRVGDPKTITGNETVIFDNLPLYTYSRDANDNLVRTLREYKVVESAVGGYKTTYSVDGDAAAEECEAFKLTDVEAADTTVSAGDAKTVTITNTYEAPLPQQKFGAIEITKNWEDDNNAENLRPQEITFVLMADGSEYATQTVTGTTATFENLPVYKVVDGVVTDIPVKYTVVEETVTGYDISYVDNEDIELENNVTDYVTVTNTFNHTIKTGNVSVSKVWQDIFGDPDNGKNDSVDVTLYADSVSVGTQATPASFTGLRLYKYSRADDGSIIETPINYTVTEETVDGYTVSYKLDGAALDGSFNLIAETTSNVTVTNKKNARSQEKGSIAVTKVWDDTANTENIIHPVITVTLTSDDGAQDRTATITYPATTVTFEDLPVYKVVDGVVTDTKVSYKLTESSVDGYEISYTDNEDIELENSVTDNVTVTNTFNYTIEKGSVTVSKVWQNENGNPVDTIDDSVTVTLYADGNVVGTETLTRTSTASFDDLSVYKYTRDNDGKIVKTVIQYTLSETPIDGYITSYTIDASELNGGFDLETTNDRRITVTNRKESPDQKHGSVKVTKTWDDGGSSLRPEAITVVLSSDDNAGERTMLVTPDAQGKWEATFTGLPVFKTDANGNVTGEKVTYTLTETSVDGYSVAYTGNENIQLAADDTAEVTVTNTLTHTPEKGSITVNKVWQDENGGALAQNEKVEISVTLSDTVNGNSDLLRTITTGESSVTFDNLPVYESYERNANGIIVGVNPITYYVTETAVNGFETTYSVSPSSGLSLVTSSTGEVTITNKKKPMALGSIKVTKKWVDTANTAGIAHPAITVVLKADGIQTAIDTIDANESTAVFENLPVYKADGITKIQYSVVEQTAVGYGTVAYSPEGSFALAENTEISVTITNTFDYDLKKGNISVTKRWVDSDGSDLAINDTIIVKIIADGEEVASDTITGSGTKTFSDLPLYKYTRNNDGSITSTEITYTVTETSAVSGYTVSYTLDGVALEGGFALVAGDTRDVVIENKKIAVTPPSSSESQSTTPSGGSGGGDETDENGDSSETTPTQSNPDTEPSQSSSDTRPSQSNPGTRPSYTSPSYIQTTTTVKNTTTTTAADTTKDEGTTAPDADEPEDTVVDEDTDTTKPADPDDYEEDDGEEPDYSDDYEEDDSDEVDESEDEEDEMYDEDGGIDDYIGEDTDFETGIEENPHTSITINFGYVLSFAFGTYAFFPRKKKKN